MSTVPSPSSSPSGLRPADSSVIGPSPFSLVATESNGFSGGLSSGVLGAGVGCLLTFEMKEPEWVRVTPSEGLERVATLGSALDGRVESLGKTGKVH